MTTTAPPATFSPIRTLPRGEPDVTLGWHIASWCERYLLIPGGPQVGDPWTFTDEQLDFVLWWYALDAEGRFLYRRGVIRRSKGWGKDPLGMALALAELVGPSRVDRIVDDDAFGKPVLGAQVRVAAVAMDQVKRNSFSHMRNMISNRMRSDYNMEVGEEIVRGYVGGFRAQLLPVTKASVSAEGDVPSHQLITEAQGFKRQNGGHAMYQTIEQNLSKSPDPGSRMLSLANAHSPGDDSSAERDYLAWRAQQAADYTGPRDILYFSVEPDLPEGFEFTDDELLLNAIAVAYGESDWVDHRRILGSCRDPSRPQGESQRWYLNRLVAGGGKWMDPSAWDAARLNDFTPAPGERITLGFDGSRTRDTTALVATTLEGGVQWPVAAWQRDWSRDDWEVPVEEVQQAIEQVFGYFTVVRFYADPHWWEDEVAGWCGRWDGIAVAWYTGGRSVIRMGPNLARLQDGDPEQAVPPRRTLRAAVPSAHPRGPRARGERADRRGGGPGHDLQADEGLA